MNWQIKINDPSGEIRTIPLKGTSTLGRSQQSNIILRDPTTAPEAAILWAHHPDKQSPYWIRIPSSAPAGYLGDLAVREAHIPPGVPFKIGETRCLIAGRRSAPYSFFSVRSQALAYRLRNRKDPTLDH